MNYPHARGTRPCNIEALCLAWSARKEDSVEGKWLCNRGCLNAKVESAFGSKRVVTMRGADALLNMLQTLQSHVIPPKKRAR